MPGTLLDFLCYFILLRQCLWDVRPPPSAAPRPRERNAVLCPRASSQQPVAETGDIGQPMSHICRGGGPGLHSELALSGIKSSDPL